MLPIIFVKQVSSYVIVSLTGEIIVYYIKKLVKKKLKNKEV